MGSLLNQWPRLRLQVAQSLAIVLIVCLVGACIDRGRSSANPKPTGDTSSGEGNTSAGAESSASDAKSSAPKPIPNIVLLLTDDQILTEMSALPKTRALIGDQGVTFEKAISQYPLCCPARASLLSGQLPHNHGAMGNVPPWGGWDRLRDRDNLLPVWLQDAGYRTAIVGKYLNGYPERGAEQYVPPGWTDWVVPIDNQLNYRSRTVNYNGDLIRDESYQSVFVSTNVNRIIEKYAESDSPFFIWAGFLAPHDGGPRDPVEPNRDIPPFRSPHVEPRYRDTEIRTLPDKPSLFETDLSDKAPIVRRSGDFVRVDVEIQAQQRLESLRSVDEAVAQIVDTLRGTGELDDTIVVFTSDNGFLLGEHGLDQKVLGYEESIRVPLLMSGPGVPSGESRDQLVGLPDLVATMLDWAGATASRPQDGTSLVPALSDPGAMSERYLLLESGGAPYPKVERLYTGIRTSDDRVLLKYFDGWIETYDLATDPFQLDGTASASERRWKGDLLAELRQLQDCSGPSCLTP